MKYISVGDDVVSARIGPAQSPRHLILIRCPFFRPWLSGAVCLPRENAYAARRQRAAGTDRSGIGPGGKGPAVSYNAADITELDDVQHTRLRPAVNLGLDVLNTALRELVDNAIEEVADPSHGGSTVTITLHADGSVSVADDGRGLPIDSDPVNGKNGIVKTLGTARAGGKFSAHTDASSTGAGLNGIGAAAAVFISARRSEEH